MAKTTDRLPSVSELQPPSADSENTGGIALRCQRLVKSYADLPAVDHVSFAVNKGDILALVGPSGCGKTTTLRLIAGFEQPDSGIIEIGGRHVAGEGRNLPVEQRRTGMVFQDYALFPHMNVGRNIGFALGKPKEAASRIAELLQFVGLTGQENKMPNELSGGEQQRVSLARALSIEPILLLLDEPFSNLDAALRMEMRAEVRSLLKASGTTAVFVTHDQEEALFLGDQIGVMHHGRLEQIDTPENIYHQPETRFVAEFIGQTDFLPGIVASGGVQTSLGLIPYTTTLPSGSAVEFAVRPDHIALRVDQHGQGRVLSRQFVGMANIYRIVLPDGTVLRSRLPHAVQLAENTMVKVELAGEQQLPCFHRDRAI